MSIQTYSPQFGSVPHKVLQFLLANPEEELTRQDIATKFDTKPGSVEGALQLAKSRGALVAVRNSKMQLVWKLGDAKVIDLVQPAAEPDEQPVASASAPSSLQAANWPAPAPAPAAPPAAVPTPRGQATQDQIASVMLQHGTPEQQRQALEYASAPAADDEFAGMPFTAKIEQRDVSALFSKTNSRRALIVQRYNEWFARFQPKDTATFARTHLRDVAYLAGRYGRLNGMQFRCRFFGDSEALIVREA